MNTKLIIFDFDGTLGDTRRNIVMTMQQTISEMGLPARSERECAATIGLPLKGCFHQLFPEMDDSMMEKSAATYRRLFDENKKLFKPALFPNVSETLSSLHNRGIVMAIASSRSSRSLHEFVDDMSLTEYISYIVGADDVTLPKPNAEPVLKILSALDISAAETIVVGDMPVDILMGANAGTLSCGVTYGNATREQLEEVGANYIINDMAQLLEFV
jgi:phosphoglycolate phosphatase